MDTIMKQNYVKGNMAHNFHHEARLIKIVYLSLIVYQFK